MKPWVRTLMIVVGILVMLVLIIYTDPTSLREFFNEKSVHSRARIAGNPVKEIEASEVLLGINFE